MKVYIVLLTSYYTEFEPGNGSTSVVRVLSTNEAADRFVAVQPKSSWEEYEVIEEWVDY